MGTKMEISTESSISYFPTYLFNDREENENDDDDDDSYNNKRSK